MTRTIRICLLGFACLSACGCDIYHTFKRTMITEPHQFNAVKDRHHSERENYAAAAVMWEEFVQCSADVISPDYRDGFIQGAAETIRYGCTNQVPLVPHRRYWHRNYRNPEGRQAISDWFAGFEAGLNYVLTTGVDGWTKTIVTGGLPPLFEMNVDDYHFDGDAYLNGEPLADPPTMLFPLDREMPDDAMPEDEDLELPIEDPEQPIDDLEQPIDVEEQPIDEEELPIEAAPQPAADANVDISPVEADEQVALFESDELVPHSYTWEGRSEVDSGWIAEGKWMPVAEETRDPDTEEIWNLDE